jgi:hypothetical protein
MYFILNDYMNNGKETKMIQIEEAKETNWGYKEKNMNQERLNTIAYMEGFVEDFIENFTESIIENPSEETTPEDHKQAQELLFAWQAVSAGLCDLRKENADLEIKLMLAKQALG